MVRRSRRTPSLVLSLALAALAAHGGGGLTPAAASAATAADDCSPPGQLRSTNVARAQRPDGLSEVTELLGDGGYRVTRCDRAGRLVVSQTVSPLRDPDGGVVLVPTERQEPGVAVAALYGDPGEASWARAFRAARSTLRASVIAPTVPVSAPPAPALPLPSPGADHDGHGAPPATRPDGRTRPPLGSTTGGTLRARAAIDGDGCTNTQYAPWLGAWAPRVYGYYVNRSRFNYNDTTVASIVRGHRNWDTTRNGCGLNDITNLTSVHAGSTSFTIHTYPDGASVTDRGDLGNVGCAGALACTWLFTDGLGNATETDQRYNEDITFSNVGASGAYDYESVSTHESGHSIGLTHANSSDALSMYFAIFSGTTHARTLAKGDVVGLRARYP